MNLLLIIALFILGAAASVAAFILGTWVVVWNVNDVIAHGANFWNIFWIGLVAVVFLGGTAKVAS